MGDCCQWRATQSSVSHGLTSYSCLGAVEQLKTFGLAAANVSKHGWG